MPISMMLATERPQKTDKRVLIVEPFPAFNTTDAFIADKRTVELIEYIFEKYNIERKTGMKLVVCAKDKEWEVLK